MLSAIATELTQQCAMRMEENTTRTRKCLETLDEDDVWERPNPYTVSIANLILHLCGNMGQYIISSLGGAPDIRERDKEFSATGGFTKNELMEMLLFTTTEAKRIIMRTSDDELMRIRAVQGFELTGIGIIIHVTEHYSYHTGQIALHTKLLKEKDLGFYAGINLNEKNTVENK